ncbi:MAG: hypothetical protein K1X88_19740 [Nannocystaceae bacterium]|nr:hypothetical protein [Nannocystaceae bacterium]
MPVPSAWPELQPLAQRIAVGELDGDDAIAAIVDAIVAREIAAGAPASVAATVRREAVAAVQADRVLVAMLRPVLPTALAQTVTQGVAQAPARTRTPTPVPTPTPTRRPSKVRVAPREHELESTEVLEDSGTTGPAEFERAQTGRKLTAAVGVVAGIGAGVAAWLLVLRETPCERFAHEICIELAAPCTSAEVEAHLERKGVDDAACIAAREAAETAASTAGSSKRTFAFETAVVGALGFDPRTGEPPVAKVAVEQGPVAPVMLARKLPPLLSLVADEAHVYVSSGEAVLRLRSVGGQFEPIATAAAARDIAVTQDFVYWVARDAAGVEALFVDRKRGEYEPTTLPTAPAKLGATACVQAQCVYVDLTDGAIWAVGQDGAAARKLTGPLAPAPSALWLDDAELAWASPGTPGTIAAMPLGGGTPRVVAGAETQPRALAGDADGWVWIAGDAVHAVPRAGGDVQTLLPQGAGALALDRTRVLVTVPGQGTLLAVPRAGGDATALASGQTGLDRLSSDSAAAFWTAGAELYRVPK